MTPRPPVSAAELDAFDARYGVTMPADLRNYFLLSDGMTKYDSDTAGYSFWELSRILPLTHGGETYSRWPNAKYCFTFADWLQDSAHFCIHLPPHGESRVRFSFSDKKYLKFESWTEFVEAYLKGVDLFIL